MNEKRSLPTNLLKEVGVWLVSKDRGLGGTGQKKREREREPGPRRRETSGGVGR